MADVIGYEERAEATMRAVRSGYPRFVEHFYVGQVQRWIQQHQGLAGQAVYAVTSRDAALMMIDYVGAADASWGEAGGTYYVAFPENEDHGVRAKHFLQHTGSAVLSRQAEDILHQQGELQSRQAEDTQTADPAARINKALRQYVDSDTLVLASGGMAAFFGALRAARRLQRRRRRRIYLQLGWLYLDTQCILDEFLAEDEHVLRLYDVFDRQAIEAVFAEHGAEIAAVITELPTNPLVQTLDVGHLSDLCLEHGAMRVFDPALVSVANVDILPYSDILVTSLTKYAAHEGDILIGAAAVNPDSPFAAALENHLRDLTPSPYPRDLERLACEIQTMPQVVEAINANTVQVAQFLEQHPSVAKVHWAYSEASRNNYVAIARGPEQPGSIITIELAMPLREFYDRSYVVKGPSFGTGFTLMCPYMYLAHYPDVTDEAKRAELRRRGLDPDLVRISIGTEPYEDIARALAAGLDSA
jgi:cystathionine gamma-synthase